MGAVEFLKKLGVSANEKRAGHIKIGFRMEIGFEHPHFLISGRQNEAGKVYKFLLSQNTSEGGDFGDFIRQDLYLTGNKSAFLALKDRIEAELKRPPNNEETSAQRNSFTSWNLPGHRHLFISFVPEPPGILRMTIEENIHD